MRLNGTGQIGSVVEIEMPTGYGESRSMKETILHLVRFFDKEEYADQFLQGHLRLNRLRYYKQLEACGDGR